MEIAVHGAQVAQIMHALQKARHVMHYVGWEQVEHFAGGWESFVLYIHICRFL
jgi:hypothetical protein